MKHERILAALIVLLCGADAARAWTPGSTGASFLRLGIGAREAGMGEAFTGAAYDADTISWNPAGLAQIQRPEVSLMHYSFVADTNYESVAYAQPFGFGTLAGSLVLLNTAPFDITGGNAPSVSAGDYVLSVGYGNRLGALYPFHSWLDRLLVGANLKTVGMGISGSGSYQFLALDLGAKYDTQVEGLSLGLDLQNMGLAMNALSASDSLPFAARLGAAYAWKEWLGTADLVRYLDQTTYFHLGAEGMWNEKLAYRMGLKFGDPSVNGFQSMTFGAGYMLRDVRLDYAFVPYGVFGATHRLSLDYAFGAGAEKPAPPPQAVPVLPAALPGSSVTATPTATTAATQVPTPIHTATPVMPAGQPTAIPSVVSTTVMPVSLVSPVPTAVPTQPASVPTTVPTPTHTAVPAPNFK